MLGTPWTGSYLRAIQSAWITQHVFRLGEEARENTSKVEPGWVFIGMLKFNFQIIQTNTAEESFFFFPPSADELFVSVSWYGKTIFIRAMTALRKKNGRGMYLVGLWTGRTLYCTCLCSRALAHWEKRKLERRQLAWLSQWSRLNRPSGKMLDNFFYIENTYTHTHTRRLKHTTKLLSWVEGDPTQLPKA